MKVYRVKWTLYPLQRNQTVAYRVDSAVENHCGFTHFYWLQLFAPPSPSQNHNETTQRFKLPFGLLFSHQLQPIAPALNGKLMHPTAHENNSLDGPSEQWMAFSQCACRRLFCLSRSVRYEREMAVLSVCVKQNVNALARARRASRRTATDCDGGRYFNGSLTFAIVMCPPCTV